MNTAAADQRIQLSLNIEVGQLQKVETLIRISDATFYERPLK